MTEQWRWALPTLLLAAVLAAFMALDKSVLHWYVPESDAPVAMPAPTTEISAFEAKSLAGQWISATFGSLDGYDCADPELSGSGSRWTTVCTERSDENPLIKVVAIDATTGAAQELVSQ